MSEEARRIQRDAEAARDARLAATRAEIAAQVEDARASGEAEGASQAEHLREEIAQLRERMVKEVDAEIVRTALRVASEALVREAKQRKELVVDVALAALSTVRTARDIGLRANPKDAAALREAKERLVSTLVRARDLDVREDRRVAQGGVLVETESGVIDAQLETQLEEIARALKL